MTDLVFMLEEEKLVAAPVIHMCVCAAEKTAPGSHQRSEILGEHIRNVESHC